MGICSKLSRIQSNQLYLEVLADKDEKTLRRLCLEDLFFLLTVAMNRPDINRDWLYDRCREVEQEPNGHLDLWAREHYKSTIITFGKTIQDILVDPNTTNGIFSHTRPIAKAFLNQIKTEFEGNEFLKDLFPDVLYKEPRKQSSRWSLDNGIVVKRTQNPKEATVEAWGLVDGQPVSKHFDNLIYDDVVTQASVTTPEQIAKTIEAWELSLALGAEGGNRRTIGTRYHFNDAYRTMMERGSVIQRIYPATDDGTMDGNPVFLAEKSLQAKRRDMGPYIFGCQMLQDPKADGAMGFKEEWLEYRVIEPQGHWNYYITVDPASAKKRDSDYTVMTVIALGSDLCYYLIDGIRARMNLTERTNNLFKLVRKWKPLNVGYEQYGLQADIEHIKYVQQIENYSFKITPVGGSMPKNDRIRRLVPIFEQHRFILPHRLLYKDEEGSARDFVKILKDTEFIPFPVAVHDDMMDCISRIVEEPLQAFFPDDDAHQFSYIEHDTGYTANNEYEVI
jgi:phage terminase large subunit-like protein